MVALICQETHALIVRIPTNNGKAAGSGTPRAREFIQGKRNLSRRPGRILKKLLENISMESDSDLRKAREKSPRSSLANSIGISLPMLVIRNYVLEPY